MKAEQGQITMVGSTAPGTEYLALDCEDDLSLVSVYVSVPRQSDITGSFVRVNLFGDLCNTRQHLASAICPMGTVGEIITVSGHTVDSYHVTLQATHTRQKNIKLGMAAKPCCAEPRVRVRADLLPFAFAPGELGLGELQWFPMVPWGVEHGAAQTYAVAGSNTLLLPTGARLTHWQALGSAPGASLQFDSGGVSGTPFVVGQTTVREGFPAAESVSAIVYTSLTFGLFDIVV